MGGNTPVSAVDFHKFVGVTDIHGLPAVYVGNGVPVFLKGNMEIGIYFPSQNNRGDFIRSSWKSPEIFLLVQPYFIAASLLFLEGLPVVLICSSHYILLQLAKSKVNLIAKTGDDSGGNISNRILHGCFLLGLPHTGRHNSS